MSHELIIEILFGIVGALTLFILKGIKSDINGNSLEIKSLRQEMKEEFSKVNKKLDDHATRLTVIETGMRYSEWMFGVFHADRKEKINQD